MLSCTRFYLQKQGGDSLGFTKRGIDYQFILCWFLYWKEIIEMMNENEGSNWFPFEHFHEKCNVALELQARGHGFAVSRCITLFDRDMNLPVAAMLTRQSSQWHGVAIINACNHCTWILTFHMTNIEMAFFSISPQMF